MVKSQIVILDLPFSLVVVSISRHLQSCEPDLLDTGEYIGEPMPQFYRSIPSSVRRIANRIRKRQTGPASLCQEKPETRRNFSPANGCHKRRRPRHYRYRSRTFPTVSREGKGKRAQFVKGIDYSRYFDAAF